MADRYWVSVASNDWHLAANWSLTSGGAGGAGIPTNVDDVFFDGNGFIICRALASIACNNLTFTAAATEMVLVEASGIIYGDFSIAAGYWGQSGNLTLVEFQGNWLNTGGTFSGSQGTIEFSGTDKTYHLDQLSSASFRNILVSGTLTVTSTRLSAMEISEKLSITGTMTVTRESATEITRITLSGTNAGFDEFTGTLTGTGRLRWVYRESHEIPTTGTISLAYVLVEGYPGLVSGDIDEDLPIDSWTNVHSDWTHVGIEPWIDTNDGDTSYISLPADTLSEGLYDEEYGVADLPTHDPLYDSVIPTKVKIHFVGKLIAGAGGPASIAIIRGYLWDGTVWQDGGTAFILGEIYSDRACSGTLHVSIDDLAKLNNMRLKIEVDSIIGGGADKGDVRITQAYVEVEGDGYWNPVFDLAPRTWSSPCEVELEYTDNTQTFRFEGTDRHYFMNKLTIRCDVAPAFQHTALFDCDTNAAQIWVNGKFNIDNNSFSAHIFTIRFGDGTHVFRGTIDFYFAYSSGASTQLVVDPGEGTIILWPRGRQIIIP